MKKETQNKTRNAVTLPCGCRYEDKGWLLVRVYECERHKRKRARKRPYRPKAECVRP